MSNRLPTRRRLLAALAGLAVALAGAACSGNSTAPAPTATGAPSTQATPGPADTPAPTTAPAATPTVEPLAARVNGDPIPLAEFEQELARYEAAQVSQGFDLAQQGDYRTRVLNVLVEQTLVEQAAEAAGLSVTDAEVEAEIQGIVDSLGGAQPFADYLAANGYTEEQFRQSLKSQLLASKITAQVADQVPTSVEQAHARHILVDTQAEAEGLLAQLQSGADFATLAFDYSRDSGSRIVGGDLGWFPRGWLTVPQVEQAAFELPLSSLSGVVQSELGYHIVQPLEREVRELDPNTLQGLRSRTVDEWVQSLKASAQIEIFITP